MKEPYRDYTLTQRKTPRIRSWSTSTEAFQQFQPFEYHHRRHKHRQTFLSSQNVRCLISVIVFGLISLSYWLLVNSNGRWRSTGQTALMTISRPKANREHYYDRALTTYLVEPLEPPFAIPSYEAEEPEEDGSVILIGGIKNEDIDDDNGSRVQLISARQTRFQTKESPNEVNSLLDAAVQYRDAGKRTKAARLRLQTELFEHALSVAPLDPDVLTEYGIFMEAQREMIKADGMYTKALVHCPDHQHALSNRERMAPLIEEIDNEMLHSIDEKRSYFLSIPRTNLALRRAMKESYYMHVYHTIAIEGNSMNVIQTRSILETRMAVAGKSVVEHNEVLGMDAALRYLNRTLDIKAIHKRVLGFADPIQAGEFRSTQVYVGNFQPVHPSELEYEMQEFITWLNDEDTVRLHPVELAALAHYKFVYIHPFIDGNGRTSRLLMNLILMQAGFPPVSIRVDDRLEYYETLQQANEGDIRPFIRFIAQATDRTLQQYIDAVTVHDLKTNRFERTTSEDAWSLVPTETHLEATDEDN